jgi:hypothetical protein
LDFGFSELGLIEQNAPDVFNPKSKIQNLKYVAGRSVTNISTKQMTADSMEWFVVAARVAATRLGLQERVFSVRKCLLESSARLSPG